MLKRTITSVDLDGNEYTEDIYLNLTKKECFDLNFKYENDGGVIPYMKKILKQSDGTTPRYKPMLDFLEVLVGAAYGVKSSDGKRLIKEENGRRLFEDFKTSEAYSELIMPLLLGEEDIEKFLLAIFPNIPEGELAKARAQADMELGLNRENMVVVT